MQRAKREAQCDQPASSLPSPAPEGSATAHRRPPAADRLLSTSYSLLPWLCLALIFWIPGIYLEWPSDPWEHLRRINEWRILDEVTAHSAWKKSSYFLPYSLTQQTTGLTQLNWLNLYYTAVCLLLSWQYYRLARAVGLSECASFVFVFLNALTFGNSIFSFHRYYGLSSSIFAQLSAVALTRVALEAARGSAQSGAAEGDRKIFSLPPFALVASALCLAVLTALNHVQGLGLAGLGLASVLVWRLIEWRRTMIAWLAMGVAGLSLAVLWWLPRHPALDTIYRPGDWLTAWYGFNLFQPTSPAFERGLAVVGFSGAISLGAAFWLLLRNHVVGWLTLVPVVALCLPPSAIPLANILAATHADNIVTFHRMLLALPPGLALLAILPDEGRFIFRSQTRRRPSPSALGLAAPTTALLLFTVLPPSGPVFNRLWNAVMIAPSDLQLDDVSQPTDPAILCELPAGLPYSLIYPRPVGAAAYAAGTRHIAYDFRVRAVIPPNNPSEYTPGMVSSMLTETTHGAMVIMFLPANTALVTSDSQAGYLSQHWSPRQVALDLVPVPELAASARADGWREIRRAQHSYFMFTPPGR